MKLPKRTILIFVIFLSFVAYGDGIAQWKKIKQSLVAPVQVVPQSFGAIHYKDGMLWAGWKNLWRSSDLGVSWDSCTTHLYNIGDIITDINFFDKTNGLFSTATQGIFITSDGGLNWRRILTNPNGVLNVAFAGSVNTIYALSGDGVFSVSFNRGATWRNTRPGGDFGICFAEALDKTIYVLSTGPSLTGEEGVISASTDQGATWTLKGGKPDGDSYSICTDSCDALRLYIANEDHQSTVNDLSDLYYSPDGGNVCVSAVAFPIPYLTGGMTCSKNAIFASTLAKGIYRSTDKGISWKPIGGVQMPNPRDNGMAFDARNIACVNDNNIFLLDIEGSIWHTNNSGGDSLIEPVVKLVLSPDTLFQKDIITPCDSPISKFVKFFAAGCPSPTITNLSLEGNSSPYTIIPAAGDSLGVRFAPPTLGAFDADVIITLSNGAFDTLPLRGFGSRSLLTATFLPDTLFKTDSSFTCDSVTNKYIYITSKACPFPKLVNASLSGDASSFEIVSVPDTISAYDSVTLTFRPTAIGRQNADLILRFEDGSTLKLPVAGYGIPPIPPTIIVVDQTADTLGGTVIVPISIGGLQKTEDVILVVHYDPLLTYDGSFSLANTRLDIPGEQWIGRSKIRIPQATTTGISANAYFEIFNDSISTQLAWFDSIEVVTAVPPCRYGIASVATANLTAAGGCASRIISRFIHFDEMPQFSVSPNPTGGSASITSSANLGEASVQVIDMLGAERSVSTLTISKNSPVKIKLPVPNGVYVLRIRSIVGIIDLRIVVNK